MTEEMKEAIVAEELEATQTNKNEIQPETERKPKKKIVLRIISVLQGVFVFFMLFISILTIGANLKQNTNGISKIPLTGSALFTVRSGSMSPTFNEGDLVYGKVIDPETYDFSKIVANKSIITFKFTIVKETSQIHTYNTHRVIGIETKKEDGLDRYYFITKGDNNKDDDTEHIAWNRVVAVYRGRIPLVGSFVNTLQGNTTLFFCVIVLPLILLFLANALYFIRIFYTSGKEKALEGAMAIKEEEKAKLLEEARKLALEELRKEREAGKKPQDE